MGLELTKRTHWLANEPRDPPVSTFSDSFFGILGIKLRFLLLNETLPQFSPFKDSQGYTV